MKSPSDYTSAFGRVENEEHPRDREWAFYEFVQTVQRDAAQDTLRSILTRLDELNVICLSDFPEGKDSVEDLCQWLAIDSPGSRTSKTSGLRGEP